MAWGLQKICWMRDLPRNCYTSKNVTLGFHFYEYRINDQIPCECGKYSASACAWFTAPIWMTMACAQFSSLKIHRDCHKRTKRSRSGRQAGAVPHFRTLMFLSFEEGGEAA